MIKNLKDGKIFLVPHMSNESEMTNYNDAKNYKKLNIRSSRQYFKIPSIIKQKYKIPANPFLSYKNDWKGWPEFWIK